MHICVRREGPGAEHRGEEGVHVARVEALALPPANTHSHSHSRSNSHLHTLTLTLTHTLTHTHTHTHTHTSATTHPQYERSAQEHHMATSLIRNSPTPRTTIGP